MGKKMLGGESSLEQCLHSGRMMKKKLSLQPCNLRAQMLQVLCTHTGQATMLRGQVSS